MKIYSNSTSSGIVLIRRASIGSIPIWGQHADIFLTRIFYVCIEPTMTLQTKSGSFSKVIFEKN